MTSNKFLKENGFYGILPIVLIITFLIHLQLFSFSDTEYKLFILSYVLNALLAVIIYLIISFTIKNKPEVAGFVFMAGSGLKFTFFFLLFYPTYKEDGQISKQEFLSFFIPYTISLITEVYFLVKRLNK